MVKDIEFIAWIDDKNCFADKIMITETGSWIAEIKNMGGFSEKDNGILLQYTMEKDIEDNKIYDGDLLEIIYYERKGNENRDIRIVTNIVTVYWGEYSDGEYVDRIKCWMVRYENSIMTYPLSELCVIPTFDKYFYVVKRLKSSYEK